MRFPWHPYLFGLFPVLFLYAQNAFQVSLRQVTGSVLVVLATIAFLIGLLNLAARNIRKTSLVVSLVVAPRQTPRCLPRIRQVIYGTRH